MSVNTLTLELLEKLTPEVQAEALRFVQSQLARHPESTNPEPHKTRR